MRVIKMAISDGREYPGRWTNTLVEVLSGVKKRGGRIFHTRYSYNDKRFLLMTTSTKIALYLCEMPDEGISALCDLLREGFEKGEPQILLVNPETQNGLLVTPVQREPDSNYTHVFQLSPA